MGRSPCWSSPGSSSSRDCSSVAASPRERRGSVLSPLAIGLALLALEIAALLDLVGAISLTVGGGFALVLLVLGALGSARRRVVRTRAVAESSPRSVLAPLALLATVITIPLDQGFGDRSFAVTRVVPAPRELHDRGAGPWSST